MKTALNNSSGCCAAWKLQRINRFLRELGWIGICVQRKLHRTGWLPFIELDLSSIDIYSSDCVFHENSMELIFCWMEIGFKLMRVDSSRVSRIFYVLKNNFLSTNLHSCSRKLVRSDTAQRKESHFWVFSDHCRYLYRSIEYIVVQLFVLQNETFSSTLPATHMAGTLLWENLVDDVQKHTSVLEKELARKLLP
jgi:hypothetical protein